MRLACRVTSQRFPPAQADSDLVTLGEMERGPGLLPEPPSAGEARRRSIPSWTSRLLLIARRLKKHQIPVIRWSA
jgi:hypothetical protein